MALTAKQQYYLIHKGMERISREERQLIEFYELQWHLRHHVPTVDESAEHLNFTHTQVNYFLTNKAVIKAIESRGIPWKQHSQADLTPSQVAAAVTVMNFADTRSNEAKLDQLGILPAQYYAWLNDPQFKNLIDNLADQNLTNIRPAAIGEFTKKINAGDWNAIRYWLETTGELQNDSQPQSEQLLQMIVEIIQRHVKDPAIIVAIAQDIKFVSQNRTMEVKDPREIIGEVVEDLELADARKKLGI